MTTNNNKINHNFYEDEFPTLDDIVFVKFNNFDEMKNGLVSLVEYSNIEGMLQPSEINKKRNVRPEKILKKGQIYPCVVVNVDKNKGHVDLSYIKVTSEEKEKYMLKYISLEKIVNLGKDISYMYTKSKQEDKNENKDTNNKNNNQEDMDSIFENTLYHIFKKNPLKTTDMDSLYNKLLEFPKEIFKFNKSIETSFIDDIIKNINDRTKSTETTIDTVFNMTIIEEDAVSIIKKLLTENIPKNIKVECQSSPKYKITVTHDTIKLAEEDLHNYITDLKKRILLGNIQNSSYNNGEKY